MYISTYLIFFFSYPTHLYLASCVTKNYAWCSPLGCREWPNDGDWMLSQQNLLLVWAQLALSIRSYLLKAFLQGSCCIPTGPDRIIPSDLSEACLHFLSVYCSWALCENLSEDDQPQITAENTICCGDPPT